MTFEKDYEIPMGLFQIVQSILLNENFKRARDAADMIPVESLDYIFALYAEILIGSLANPEKLNICWEIIVSFMALCLSLIHI